MGFPVGERARRLRLEKGVTLRELAERAGLHTSSLQRIESGQQDPKHSDVLAIASALRLTIVQFYSRKPPKPKPGRGR